MSRHVNGWENPYTAATSRHQVQAEENYRKVLQRKAERLYCRQLHSDPSLENLESIRESLAAADRRVTVSEKKSRVAVVKATTQQPAQFRATYAIDTPVRAVEVTLGGATTWTAENDGGMSIRSGVGGEVVVTIPPREGGATVDVLYATATHMWAGLSDGTVIVLDHLVFVQVTEGTFHSTNVTAFAELSDNRMLSLSSDGSIVKWDTEAKNFEAITKIVPQGLGPITAACARGTIVYCGSSTAVLISLDAQSGTQVCSYSGHHGSITSVAVQNDYLFSASTDSTIRVWNATVGACLKVTGVDSLPQVLLPMAGTNRMWVGLQSGIIQVWRTLPDDGFTVERTIRTHEGRQLVALRAMAAVETLKIWTLASDGTNKVWSSMFHHAEEGLKTCVESLRAVITQDTIELDKWRSLVQRLEVVDARRKTQLCGALQSYHSDVVRRRFLWTWTKYVKRQQEHRRRMIVCEKLAFEARVTLARSTFAKWYTWYRTSQSLTMKRRFADIGQSIHEAHVKAAYAMKLVLSNRESKRVQIQRALSDYVGCQNAHAAQNSVFRKWIRYVQIKKDAASRDRNAKVLEWFNSKLLQRKYLSLWMRVRERAAKRAQQQQYAQQLLRASQLQHLQRSYSAWVAFVALRLKRSRQLALAVMLSHTNRLRYFRLSYSAWRSAGESAKLRRVQASNEATHQRLAAIRQRYSDMSLLFEEKRKIAALQKQGELDDAAIEKAKNRVAALERECLRLQEERLRKEAQNSAKDESLHDQLEHVMSQLKSSVINYYSDCQLFHQTREKCRAGQSVVKMFLEAHQSVKRCVVEVTKNPHLSAFERWPLTAELLQKIPTHQMAVLLGAIKTMIIAFDIMERSDHDQLTSNQEIVLNAHWLMMIAKLCTLHKKKAALGLRR